MEVFLSYGHPEHEICVLRIVDALRQRGHKPWFDLEKLDTGDWREKLAEGIGRSDAVVSCLSRHAVREPGVCLDELSIAVGVRGGNIQTILLEPEQVVEPPASLCHLQWLDMSQWRKKLSAGEAVFRPWFDVHMARLFEVIESPESRSFVGQITAIRKKLFVNYDSSRQRELLSRRFVGRRWLAEQVDGWLDDPAGRRLCVLTGLPGVGKSAFAANYIHRNPRVAAGLFCSYDRPLYNDARTVLMTLAYLLACRLPDYRVALSGILERETRLGQMNVPELFERLLADPLGNPTIDGGHETLCIVVDGLDECGDTERNALAETMGVYDPRLPRWLRVLVLARDVSTVREPLAGAQHLELGSALVENLADVRAYFETALAPRYGDDPALPGALEVLTARSGGIFLYAQLVAEGLLHGKLSIHDSDAFPEGLSTAFFRWFGWFFPDGREYTARFRLPLGALLAAPEPLPVEELQRLFGWGENESNDFLRRLEVLLRREENTFRKETFAFSHKYLGEWLALPQAGRYRSSRQDGLRALAEGFYRLFQADVQALTAFESLHLTALLRQSGNAEAAAAALLHHDLLWNILDAGNHCKTWGKPGEAGASYARALEMAEAMCRDRNGAEDRRDLSVSCDRVGDILEAQGDLPGALVLYQRGLELSERLAQERGTPEDLRDLSVSCDRVGDILMAQGDLPGALVLYRRDLELSERLAQERGTPNDRDDLAVSCYKLASSQALPRKERLGGRQEGPGHRGEAARGLSRPGEVSDLSRCVPPALPLSGRRGEALKVPAAQILRTGKTGKRPDVQRRGCASPGEAREK